jgi:hypothetical protein
MPNHKVSKNVYREKKNPFGSSVDHDVANIAYRINIYIYDGYLHIIYVLT